MLKSSAPIVLFACTALLQTGCGDPSKGDRPDHGCPDNEICSTVLSGLFFSGATFGDELAGMQRPPAIALGGRQTVKVWLDREGERPFDALPAGRDGSSGPFCGTASNPSAFCAHDNGLGVLAVQPATPPTVTVGGTSKGLDHLRILATYGAHASPKELYDRIILEVIEPGDVHVMAPLDIEFALLHGDRTKSMPIAFAVTSQPPAVVAGIFGVNEENQRVRLVDEGLSFSNVPGNLIRDSHWDSLKPSAPFSQTMDHLIVVTSHSGGPLGQLRLRVVGTVNDLELALGSSNHVPAGKPLVAGSAEQACFSSIARPGGQDLLVYGAKLSFEAVTNVVVTPLAGGGQQTKDSCVDIRPLSAGPVSIRVTSDSNPSSAGGEYSEVFSFTAVTSIATRRSELRDATPIVTELAPGPAPGERAGAR